MNAVTLIVATVVLGAGTFAFRYAGPVLRGRVSLSAHADKVLAVAVVVLLAALLATSALYEAEEFAGYARPAGVLVAGVLAWRRAPFVLIVVAAAVCTALLRLLGVP